MSHRSRPLRTVKNFSSALQKSLNAYTLSATAAGVALAAITPAAAEIVYTPTDHQIRANQGGNGYYLDLNHDGISDFLIVNFYSSTSALLNVWASPEQAGNEIFSNGSGYAAAIPGGVAIGSNGKFRPAQSRNMANDDFPVGNCEGPWKDADNKYLGLKFEIDGQVHFGWARLSATCFTTKAARVLITGYAYETIVGRSIVTGQTSGTSDAEPIRDSDSRAGTSLGYLALGSPGMALWRGEK